MPRFGNTIRAQIGYRRKSVKCLGCSEFGRAPALPLGAAPKNARNMATLREIELRLKSVKNIEKITKVRRCLFVLFLGVDRGYFL
ncbi:uncharacterized protein BJ212DRAFT_1416068 [Suillus subaureus]|uniref:Uncharacterized protein n=1 Tax=Suillus subaureus TaxID=48587 RepID=A0A9P7ANP2_9AGAM|nr:uncharacterized protein BJ212DRAFT_1416068 [Suillus subaureus]KAG1793211.1 hypothetical protein BJ212DRAFT_1416068 [Suillus subaureus]